MLYFNYKRGKCHQIDVISQRVNDYVLELTKANDVSHSHSLLGENKWNDVSFQKTSHAHAVNVAMPLRPGMCADHF